MMVSSRKEFDGPFLDRLAAQVSTSGASDRVPIRAPYTQEILGYVPACRPRDVEDAVERARAAQPAWAATHRRDRAAIFLHFHDLLLDRQDEALDLIQLETGKARRHAFEEVLDTAGVSRYYARQAESLLRPRRRKGAIPFLTKTVEVHSPVGVVGLVAPWNYPLNLAVTDALPALLAGNAAILKPDLQTSFTALWALDLLRQAGLPRDVFGIVTGDGPELGPPLVESVDYVMFTGSTRTGRVIAHQAAERLIGCSLELGGKNPMIVLADADLDRAIDGAIRGCFASAGQVCVSIERIYVHESVAERFLNSFAERTRALRLGAALDFTPDVGSLTSERQLRSIEEHVDDAVQKGSNVVCGGRRRPDLGPLFFEPTILTNVQPGMKAFAEETFGPVVSVYPFASEEEAIASANATRYGLNASIWTRDTRRGAELARRVRAGSVNINEAYAAVWGSVDAPCGGLKESGLGARHGAVGLLKFTHTQTIATQRLLPIGPWRGLDAGIYARWMTRLMKLLRRVRIFG